MPLDTDIASLLIVGFHGKTPSPEVKELLARGVHGVILFSRNIEDAVQVAELVAELKRLAGRPLLVAIDQEGSRATQGFTELPPMRALGDAGDEALAREVGALLGRELRAVGIDQDYAPVVDVDTNPANPVIGDRSLSRDPDAVSRLGTALALGLQAAGVAACAKHFPGHGDTSQDSHKDLPRLPHDLARLRRVELPPMRALGEAGDEVLAHEVGALLGRELRAVGIDQDYAPVVDVDTNPANPVIGDRALSRDPETVGRLGAAVARGLQSRGVAACAKHFPGHGDTSQDSHKDLPRLPHARERLSRVELLPFRALARAGVASVMTAHVVFEPLDARRPATLSPDVMRLLREEVGFDGCAISDDLQMKAVAEHFPLEDAAPGAVAAGVDAVLVCHDADVQHRAIDLVRAAFEAGRIPRERLRQARARVARLVSFAGPPPDPRVARASLRTPEHLALAARIPARAPGHDPTTA